MEQATAKANAGILRFAQNDKQARRNDKQAGQNKQVGNFKR